MSVWLEHVLAVHLDPQGGTPYWLERQAALGFSIRDAVRAPEDLVRLGPFDLAALRERPLEHFIPRALLGSRRLITSETGGATGAPKPTAYFEDELERAFVQPFLDCTRGHAEFGAGHWLWLGPSGPHVIGKVARRIALATSGSDGFSVDFDPRWYRSLAPGSLARLRYLAHVLEQALPVVMNQDVRYLFTTPPVLAALVEQMPAARRQAIRFVYLGGMVLDPQLLAEIAGLLPNALFLGGYGNSLFGVCHEAAPRRPDGTPPLYYPPAARLQLRLVPLEPGLDDAQRLAREVAVGERGQIVLSRLDESCFMPNVMERDSALRVTGGMQDPQPLQSPAFTVDHGIY